MNRMPTAAVSGGSLVGGYMVANKSGVRPLGGVVLAAAGSWCGREWYRSVGPGTTGMLLGIYLGSFGASHPLAKKIGAWPSVLSVAAVTAVATYLLADRPAADPRHRGVRASRRRAGRQPAGADRLVSRQRQRGRRSAAAG